MAARLPLTMKRAIAEDYHEMLNAHGGSWSLRSQAERVQRLGGLTVSHVTIGKWYDRYCGQRQNGHTVELTDEQKRAIVADFRRRRAACCNGVWSHQKHARTLAKSHGVTVTGSAVWAWEKKFADE